MKKQRKKLPPGSPLEWLNHAMSDLALAQLGADSEDVLPEKYVFTRNKPLRRLSRQSC